MSNKLDVKKIVSWHECEGETLNNKMESMYKKIGAYFTANAERLASDYAPNTSCVELKIVISHDSIVTLDKKIEEYILEEN